MLKLDQSLVIEVLKKTSDYTAPRILWRPDYVYAIWEVEDHSISATFQESTITFNTVWNDKWVFDVVWHEWTEEEVVNYINIGTSIIVDRVNKKPIAPENLTAVEGWPSWYPIRLYEAWLKKPWYKRLMFKPDGERGLLGWVFKKVEF